MSEAQIFAEVLAEFQDKIQTLDLTSQYKDYVLLLVLGALAKNIHDDDSRFVLKEFVDGVNEIFWHAKSQE